MPTLCLDAGQGHQHRREAGARGPRAARARRRLARAAASSRSLEERAGLPVAVGALPDEDRRRALPQRHGLDRVGQRRAVGRAAAVHGRPRVGHVCCGHEGRRLDTRPSSRAPRSDPQEVQANAFAAELLGPRAGVEAMVDGPPTLDGHRADRRALRHVARSPPCTGSARWSSSASHGPRRLRARSTRACTATSGSTSTPRASTTPRGDRRRAAAAARPARRSAAWLRGETALAGPPPPGPAARPTRSIARPPRSAR